MVAVHCKDVGICCMVTIMLEFTDGQIYKELALHSFRTAQIIPEYIIACQASFKKNEMISHQISSCTQVSLSLQVRDFKVENSGPQLCNTLKRFLFVISIFSAPINKFFYLKEFLKRD